MCCKKIQERWYFIILPSKVLIELSMIKSDHRGQNMLAGLIILSKLDDDDDDYWASPGRSYKQSWCSVCTAWHPHWFINQELGGVRSHINISSTWHLTSSTNWISQLNSTNTTKIDQFYNREYYKIPMKTFAADDLKSYGRLGKYFPAFSPVCLQEMRVQQR